MTSPADDQPKTNADLRDEFGGAAIIVSGGAKVTIHGGNIAGFPTGIVSAGGSEVTIIGELKLSECETALVTKDGGEIVLKKPDAG